MTKKKTKSKLVGFARLRVTDPDRLRAIARKAGKAAQKRYGSRIRWTKAEARKMARAGGKAVQREYRKVGHPLQIAQVRREALAKARRQKRKAEPVRHVAAMPEDQGSQEALQMEQELAEETERILANEPEQEPDPVPEKDVVNG